MFLSCYLYLIIISLGAAIFDDNEKKIISNQAGFVQFFAVFETIYGKPQAE